MHEKVCPSCGKPVHARGLCKPHYNLARGTTRSLREDTNYGKGSVHRGYRLLFLPNHPSATKHGRVPEHRLVMESTLNRFLAPNETVHHKNGNTLDNRPENLELWSLSSGKHRGQRVSDLLRWAHEIIKLYGDHNV